MPSPAKIPCARVRAEIDAMPPTNACVKVVRERDGMEWTCKDFPDTYPDGNDWCLLYWEEQ